MWDNRNMFHKYDEWENQTKIIINFIIPLQTIKTCTQFHNCRKQRENWHKWEMRIHGPRKDTGSILWELELICIIIPIKFIPFISYEKKEISCHTKND